MTLEIFVKYIHFICIFAIVATVSAEHLLLKPQLTRNEIKRLSVLDGIYGISALILLGAGLSLWLWLGKPAEFYTKNWIFHTKLTMYILMGLLSIYPTIFFLKNRKGANQEDLVAIPPIIKWLIRLELLVIFIMPLLATLMARGIGHIGN
jgi:putative membrane protein